MSKAINSYEEAVETQADVRSALGAFYTYARTRDGIPEIATATGTATRFTTLPDWYAFSPHPVLFQPILNFLSGIRPCQQTHSKFSKA